MSSAPTETLPFSWYSEQATFRSEQERIFRRSWQYVGHAGELPRPGSFRATFAGDLPVVLVRDEAGALRAFVNVCRHRGSTICDGSGERSTLQCPYHAWTYGLDGQLLRAPRLTPVAGENLGLVPLRLETWGPLLFANPDPDAPPLSDTLGDVPERLAGAGIELESLRFLRRSESEVAANWKIVAENYLECYHCPVAHPGFSAVMDVSPEAYLLEAQATRLSQYCAPRPGSSSLYDATGTVQRAQFHLLFPGTIVNVYPGRQNLSIGPLLPRSPERTARFLDYFVGPDADDAWIADMLAFDDQVGVEDKALVERVQAGVRAGLPERGRLLPESEGLIAHFQALITRALG